MGADAFREAGGGRPGRDGKYNVGGASIEAGRWVRPVQHPGEGKWRGR